MANSKKANSPLIMPASEREPEKPIQLLDDDFIKNATSQVTGFLFKMPGSSLSKILEISHELATRVHKNKNATFQLIKPESSTSYLPMHLLNVTILSLFCANELNYSQEDMKELAIASLLHDIGLPGLGMKKLLQPSKFDIIDRLKIKKHPLMGLSFLNEQEQLPKVTKITAYQHHEHFDGSGYPKGLNRFEIHEFARIVRVTDTYDAMISDRPHRPAFAPNCAMNHLISRANTLFDPFIIKKFLGFMSLFPVGSEARLNTGEMATVLLSNKERPFLPIVQVNTDKNGQRLEKPFIVDLSSQRNRFIRGNQ